MTSKLYAEIYALIRLIPKGKVMSYGGVARQIGRPGLQRVVGYALHALPFGSNVPWWRVINSQGRISNASTPDAADIQRQHLRDEGVSVDSNYRLDLAHYDAEMIVYKKLQRRRK